MLTVQLSHNRIDRHLTDPRTIKRIGVAWGKSRVRFMRPLWRRLTSGDSEYNARNAMAANGCCVDILLGTKLIFGRVLDDAVIALFDRASLRAGTVNSYCGDSASVGLYRGAARAH